LRVSGKEVYRTQENLNHSHGLRASALRRMTCIAIATVMIAVCAGIVDVKIAAAANDPVAAVRTTIDEAVPVFSNTGISPADRQKQLRKIAAQHFDFAYMTRSAMGTHWKSLTAAQREELVPLFTDHVMDTYLGTLKQNTVEAASNGLKDKVTYDGTDRASVYSEVKLPSLADPLAVNYSLRKGPDGWKLYDIVVDNISTIANYRGEFNKTMNDGGYDKLVSKLRSAQPPPANL
jgi:phospholipid transport system substrate-binding protein